MLLILPRCRRCDLLVGLDGYQVIGVKRDEGGLVVTIESPPGSMGCPQCRAGRADCGAAGELDDRAGWWAVRQLRREHASVAGLARQLGTTWRTVWRSVKPLLKVLAADQSRFEGVSAWATRE